MVGQRVQDGQIPVNRDQHQVQDGGGAWQQNGGEAHQARSLVRIKGRHDEEAGMVRHGQADHQVRTRQAHHEAVSDGLQLVEAPHRHDGQAVTKHDDQHQ